MVSMYIRPLWVAILIWSIGACATSGGEFYVAPNGDDANPGTKQQPFASLTRARDAVRQFKKANSTEDIVVLLRGGVYRLTETVVFTLEDSGSPDQTITYAAYPGETPVLSAGVPVTQWKKLSSYPQELPQSARGNVWVANVSFVRKLKGRQTPSPTVPTQMDCADGDSSRFTSKTADCSGLGVKGFCCSSGRRVAQPIPAPLRSPKTRFVIGRTLRKPSFCSFPIASGSAIYCPSWMRTKQQALPAPRFQAPIHWRSPTEECLTYRPLGWRMCWLYSTNRASGCWTAGQNDCICGRVAESQTTRLSFRCLPN